MNIRPTFKEKSLKAKARNKRTNFIFAAQKLNLIVRRNGFKISPSVQLRFDNDRDFNAPATLLTTTLLTSTFNTRSVLHYVPNSQQ